MFSEYVPVTTLQHLAFQVRNCQYYSKYIYSKSFILNDRFWFPIAEVQSSWYCFLLPVGLFSSHKLKLQVKFSLTSVEKMWTYACKGLLMYLLITTYIKSQVLFVSSSSSLAIAGSFTQYLLLSSSTGKTTSRTLIPFSPME